MADNLSLTYQGATGGSFEQQGSIDWIQLAKMSISIPISVLARVSAADVSPLTIVVGQEMSSLFQLSRTGHERLTKALGELKSFSAIGDAIWFGFGIKHLVRALAETNKGLALLTLCSCLSEIHPPKACAEILIKLSYACGAPDDLRPSAKQWINLVEACSGTLKSTTFGCIAEQFMAFHGTYVSEGYFDDAEDVAAALLAVARVSSGVLNSATLTGGRSCGWLAAIGFYFLGLDVEIRSSDNTSIYKSTTNNDSIRLLVMYDTPHSSNQVQVNSTTYVISSIDKLVYSYEEQAESIMSGTLHWNSCLSQTFGDAFQQLLRAKPTFGALIGISARVFQGLTNSETSKIFGVRDRVNRPEKAMTLHVVPGVIQTKAGREYQFIADKTGTRSDGLLGFDWRDPHSFKDTADFRIDVPPNVTETFKGVMTFDGNISIPMLDVDTGSSGLDVKLFIEESATGLLVDLNFIGPAGTCRVGAYTMLKEIINNSGLAQCAHRNCKRLKKVYGDDFKLRHYVLPGF
ncbi:hypothetical protein IL306_014156 [Fusarium sp. DS 682]|nr:hypothetical protein IL306_014156 [Fusarium sp. DS 682]